MTLKDIRPSPHLWGLFHLRRRLAILLALLIVGMTALAQDETDCQPHSLARQQETFARFLPLNFTDDRQRGLDSLFRLGAAYQALALRCGYVPDARQINAMLEQVLPFVTLDELIAAQAVGADVEKIMTELEAYPGDPLAGQLLYNGQEPALGGVLLGCAGCHENEAAAPLTAGAWTRINDSRLSSPELEGYGHRQYLIESIVQPHAYIVPAYTETMPDIYSRQLTAQHLADLIAYLDSQDQLLDEEE